MFNILNFIIYILLLKLSKIEYICDEWVTWGSLFTADEDKSYIINWIFYGFIAVNK